MSTEFKKIYAKIASKVSSDKRVIKYLKDEMDKIIHQSYLKASSSDESYCLKFTLPEKLIKDFFQKLEITEQELDRAFTKDWSLPPEKEQAHMYHEAYYQMMQLVIYIGIMQNDPKLVENATNILMFRLWNGRKSKYIQFCDKRIMSYVIAYMGTNRHLFTKYHNPFFLIKDYFTPTLIKKYGPEIKRDHLKLQRLMSQGFSRIRQIYVYNPTLNPSTGKNEAQGGILPLYIKARSEGLYLTTPSTHDDDNFDQYITTNNREEIIQNTANNITMNAIPVYPKEFINELNKELTVSAKTVEVLLKAIHNYKYFDKLQEIFTIMLSQLKINEKNNICASNFYSNVRTAIIRSKNNKDSKKLQELLNELLNDIFNNVIGRSYGNYSNVQHIKLRNVIIRGLAYNLRKINCS